MKLNSTQIEDFNRRFDERRHITIDLRSAASRALRRSDDDWDRPHLSLWLTMSSSFEDEGPCVSLGIGPLSGQSDRAISLRPQEARELAHKLMQAANDLDEIINDVMEVIP